MPGWQIALIAIGAAVCAAASAVLVYRALAARSQAVTASHPRPSAPTAAAA
jgi:hypothetical protein